MWKFNKEKINDERSLFANYICQLLWDSDQLSFDKIEELNDHLDANIRNVYELIEDEIPLVALYRLNEYGADNYDFDSDEYNEALTNTVQACYDFYGTKNIDHLLINVE